MAPNKIIGLSEKNRGRDGGLLKGLSVISGRGNARPAEKTMPVAQGFGHSEKLQPLVLEHGAEWSDVVTDLHVSQCRKWKLNPRHAIIEDRIPELAKLIRDLGQLDPIIIARAKDGSGMFDILCGQRRWLAIKSINYNEGIIKAKIVPDDMPIETMLQLAIDSQSNTDPLRDIDYAMTVIELDRQGRNPMADLGKDKATVSKLRRMGRLPDEVLAEVMEKPDKFSMNICYELTQVCPLKAEGPSLDQHAGAKGVFGGSSAKTTKGDRTPGKPPAADWSDDQRAAIKAVLKLVRDVSSKDMTVSEVVRAVREMAGGTVKHTRRSWAIYEVDESLKTLGSVKARESTGEVTVILRGVTPAGLDKIRSFTLQLAKDKSLIDREKASVAKPKTGKGAELPD